MKRFCLSALLVMGALAASHSGCSNSANPTGTPAKTATATKTPWIANANPQAYKGYFFTTDAPEAMTFDPDNGYLYVAEGAGTKANGLVEIWDETQNPATFVSSFPVTNLTASANKPILSGIAWNGKLGDVWVADNANSDVYAIGGLPDNPGYVWGDLDALGATFSGPWALASDAAGDVFVADAGKFQIEEYSSSEASGTPVTTWGHSYFYNLLSVAADPYDNIYAGDTNLNNSGSEGLMSWAPGQYVDADYWMAFYPSASSFAVTNAPNLLGIAADGNEDVYAADTAKNTVDVWDHLGNPIHQYNGSDDLAGNFAAVSDVKISPKTGDMCIADPGYNMVWIY